MAIDATEGNPALLNCSTCVEVRHRSTRAAAATQRGRAVLVQLQLGVVNVGHLW